MPRYEENIKRLFYQDVRERKSIGHGEFHRKKGSKSRKCSLPSDHLTERGWRKMNGDVITYNLQQPMDWESFKQLRPELKREYIMNLDARFGITKSALAVAFDVNVATIDRNVKGIDFGDIFGRGKRMNDVDRLSFYQFFGVPGCGDSIEESNDSVPTPVVTEEVPQSEDAVTAGTSETTHSVSAASSFGMKKFTLEFDGPFDLDNLVNSIRYMVPNGTNVELSIRCEIRG